MIPSPMTVAKVLLRAALLGLVEGLILGAVMLAALAAVAMFAVKVLR